MTSRPSVKNEELDMDSLFDFSQGTSQTSPVAGPSSQHNDSLSPFGKEERQQFNGPSHDYGQFKQQVGISLVNMPNMPQPSMYNGNGEGYNTGFSEMDFSSGYNFNTGLDFDADMTMDFAGAQGNAPMLPIPGDVQTGFINPTNLAGQDDSHSSVGRLWPGMHSLKAQQEAMAKVAQTQAAQQRQIKLQSQSAHPRQSSTSTGMNSQSENSQQSQASGKRASNAVDPQTEERISRLLNQMRQNGGSEVDGEEAADMLPHIARMKKDEEDMDEDERLLASEEGKKLSSKERRQLRNKVSARAFRSRRKEYIGQLEGEVAVRTQEVNMLRGENQSLRQENDRYRTLIETLLRHPAFTPFLNDISKDPMLLGVPQEHVQQHRQQQEAQAQAQAQAQARAQAQAQQQQQQQQPTSQQNMTPDFLNFDASQLKIPGPNPGDQTQRVNMATLPDNDFSKLNLNSFGQAVPFANNNNPARNANNYSVGAYAVTDLPVGPDPLTLLLDTPTRIPTAYFDIDTAPAAPAPRNAEMNLLLAKLDSAAQRLEARAAA